jgi:hypothetical protein
MQGVRTMLPWCSSAALRSSRVRGPLFETPDTFALNSESVTIRNALDCRAPAAYGTEARLLPQLALELSARNMVATCWIPPNRHGTGEFSWPDGRRRQIDQGDRPNLAVGRSADGADSD